MNPFFTIVNKCQYSQKKTLLQGMNVTISGCRISQIKQANKFIGSKKGKD